MKEFPTGLLTIVQERFRSDLQLDLRSQLYLASRGVTPSEIEEFEIGSGVRASGSLASLRKRLVIPLRDVYGDLIGFCGRSVYGGRPPYIYLPRGVRVSRCLFNLHRVVKKCEGQTRSVIPLLVEGPFDAISCSRAGVWVVCSYLGSRITVHQACLLSRYFSKVRLVPDTDSTGRGLSSDNVKTLNRVLLDVEVIALPRNYKDLDEYLCGGGDIYSLLELPLNSLLLDLR